jgi:hypothetical protein
VAANTTVQFVVGGTWNPENTAPRRVFVVEAVSTQ